MESGRSSAVERLPSKQDVAGSTPAGRSNSLPALAVFLAADGQGWEDIKVACNLTEEEAKAIVFGGMK